VQFCYQVSKLNVKITKSGVARKEEGCVDEVASVAEGAQARHRHQVQTGAPPTVRDGDGPQVRRHDQAASLPLNVRPVEKIVTVAGTQVESEEAGAQCHHVLETHLGNGD